MRIIILLSVCIIAVTGLWATAIPISNQAVLTDDNVFGSLVRIDPDDSLLESLKTKFWLWQDGNDLVVYAEAEIDSTFEQGNHSRRDENASGDMLRVQLVTMPQSYMAYAYVAYPLGNLADGIRKKDMSIDYSWDSHYSYRSEISADLWRVTFRIPLGELRFRQEQPYNWRVIFSRYYEVNSATYSSPYANTDQMNLYFMSSHPISLSGQITRDFPVTLKPYFVKSYDLVNHTDSFDPQNLGLDVAFVPSQKLRLKLSFNPDFSDVPMDSASDDYNNKFPPYYSENRFFFTEDLQVFNLGDYFYTRNIAQPQFAYKLTGNSGRINWGILGALDKEIRDEGVLINRADYYQAISINPSWEKFNLSNSLISRVGDGFYNHGYYGNYSYMPVPWLTVSTDNLFAIQKEQSEPDQHRGVISTNKLSYNKGDYSGTLAYIVVSADLVHDTGYITENDYDGWNLDLAWDKISPEAFINSRGINGSFSLSRSTLSQSDYDLNNQFLYAYIWLKRKLFLHTSISSGTDLGTDRDIFRTWTFNTGFNYEPIRQLNFGVRVSQGESLIYSLNEVHDRTALLLSCGINLARKFRVNYNGIFNFLGYPELNELDLGGGVVIPLILDNKYGVNNFTLVYNHSKALSLSGGMGLSTYESGGRYANLSYYGNLRYEFKPGYFLYMGLKSQQSQMEPSTISDPLGQFRRDMASAYLKVALTL